ncbi:CTP synthase 1 isoform X1 [Parasteatoda tepidariorum]|uniref:CTP synthase 1 isoform X1 n=3 Tax=Parasteatoda tepidariorum TaxID=114398 RepID=UPI00077FA205
MKNALISNLKSLLVISVTHCLSKSWSLMPRALQSMLPFINTNMKYVLVTGGVISGIGKGVIASSIGKILKSNGYEVTAIKIDPYINIDAGTFSPYEHGEVFVLDDGGEVDLDLGNYERFMDINLFRDNNITTGKIYQSVINRERKGEFLGKTVQVVPHITDAIQEWVERVALKPVSSGGIPEICIIELGGTIGDIEGMPFVEAFRQFQFRVKKENFCCVHVSLVPQPKSTGEHKSKPTQASVRELRGLGLSPDLIVCRSENPIDKVVKEKISNFCHVPPEQVVCLHDVKSVYHVPMFMEGQGMVEFFHDRLQLPLRTLTLSEEGKNLSKKWEKLVQRMDHHINEVKIALVGKYTGLEDSYASVIKALQHATLECSVKLNLKFIAAADLEKPDCESSPKTDNDLETLTQKTMRYHEAWQNLCKADGILVPGGFGSNGSEGKMAAIKWARENKIPFLGICLGFQLAVVEFARNVVGWEDADSFEIAQDRLSKKGLSQENIDSELRNKKHVIIEMPEHHTGIMGGTMRLGKKVTIFKTNDSILRSLYKKDVIEERHRHRYEVDKNYVPEIEKGGLKFIAEDETGERLEILELQDHPYFVAVQFHPEYMSRPMKPSPPYLGFILASCNKLKYVLEKGTIPQYDSIYSDDECDRIENKIEANESLPTSITSHAK